MTRHGLAAAALLLLGLGSIVLFARQEVGTALASQILHTRKMVAAPEFTDGTAISARLARAEAAVEARRHYLAVYELEGAFMNASAAAFVKKSGAVKTPADFAEYWKRTAPPRTGTPSANVPLLAEAFAASADARAPATYRAALPYANDAGVDAGLYYLGESHALAAFAAMARSLPWTAAGERPLLRSLATELDSFEQQVTSAYRGMTPEQHTGYMLTSVALKRARALAGSGSHAGALLEYLLARHRFAAIQAPAPLPVPGKPQVAAARARLTPGADHSIALLFVEMAEAGLAVALDDVVAAYLSAIEPPRTEHTTANGAAVTVTLLRWPFT